MLVQLDMVVQVLQVLLLVLLLKELVVVVVLCGIPLGTGMVLVVEVMEVIPHQIQEQLTLVVEVVVVIVLVVVQVVQVL